LRVFAVNCAIYAYPICKETNRHPVPAGLQEE
jgi:hypothetical protein